MSDSSLKILRRYQYDALDRLTDVGLLAGDSTQRFYQVNHLTTELGQQTQRTILRHEAQPLAQQQITVGVTEATLLATDQAHSVLQTHGQTNPRQLAYTAYGHHPADSGLSLLIEFSGECPDVITGHYLLGQGNRAFNPVLMRFNSPDNLSPFGEGGINCYAYCQGDPVNFNDPTGNFRIKVANPRRVVRDKLGQIQKSGNGIKRTVQNNHPVHKSSLNALGESSVTAPPSRPSTSTSASQLVKVNHTLPPTEELIKAIPDSFKNTPDYQDVVYSGKVFDHAYSNGRIQTVATKNDYKELSTHLKSRADLQDSDAIKSHTEKTNALLLKIKSTSVDHYQASTTNKYIRTN
ncbi:RHS repeat-associated core domain protein-containing protein [Pseudomonas sp. GM78]|uniref:RHS repeat-associated core domain-containing protein n=1 Tax=Pseudomonas sp. GM78 TaxID=1144337 RepID=UPI000270B97D|nr:RHS repeat-associated core domain-containing protein [Pseudomonas sp. GM78]EJN28104.1 RHS repeat-associated core domain protein-containing protein [Pseudomonas sp. GM78]